MLGSMSKEKESFHNWNKSITYLHNKIMNMSLSTTKMWRSTLSTSKIWRSTLKYFSISDRKGVELEFTNLVKAQGKWVSRSNPTLVVTLGDSPFEPLSLSPRYHFFLLLCVGIESSFCHGLIDFDSPRWRRKWIMIVDWWITILDLRRLCGRTISKT